MVLSSRNLKGFFTNKIFFADYGNILFDLESISLHDRCIYLSFRTEFYTIYLRSPIYSIYTLLFYSFK